MEQQPSSSASSTSTSSTATAAPSSNGGNGGGVSSAAMDQSFASASGSTANNNNSNSDWSDWYFKTFSRELSLNTSTSTTSNNQSSDNLVDESKRVLTEAAVLRRRLHAIDAVEMLAVPVTEVPRYEWENDASTCYRCQKDLGWVHFRRKHHCRFCGKTFCGQCAPGEVRCCADCDRRRHRFKNLQLLRAFERDALRAPSKETVFSVARAYRVAIQSFSNNSSQSDIDTGSSNGGTKEHHVFEQEARLILIEGLHSFLELEDTKACLKQTTINGSVTAI